MTMSREKLISYLRFLVVMIIGLMALGAFVRTMNAGLACPDWPLCYGKVIPPMHWGSWLEQLHRLDAGLISLAFARVCWTVFRDKSLPRGSKLAAVLGIGFLFLQIFAGRKTVLAQLHWQIVTTHLILATFFFLCNLWLLFLVDPSIRAGDEPVPRAVKWVALALSTLVFAQISLGGVVASTYAGSVCVDWPLCNGQWVPTWQGAIGNQISHRFLAYFLTVVIGLVTLVLHLKRDASWMTRQLLSTSRMMAAVVILQVGLGIANLILFIPPWLAVLHQSMAIVLLSTCVRMYAVARATVEVPVPDEEVYVPSQTAMV